MSKGRKTDVFAGRFGDGRQCLEHADDGMALRLEERGLRFARILRGKE